MSETREWPRIAVVGAGAVGGYFGGMFARAGAPTVFIGRKHFADAVNSKGLVLDKLHGEMKTILAQPEVREQIARLGMIPQDSASPEELHRYVASETVRWGKIVQQAGATGIE